MPITFQSPVAEANPEARNENLGGSGGSILPGRSVVSDGTKPKRQSCTAGNSIGPEKSVGRKKSDPSKDEMKRSRNL